MFSVRNWLPLGLWSPHLSFSAREARPRLFPALPMTGIATIARRIRGAECGC